MKHRLRSEPEKSVKICSPFPVLFRAPYVDYDNEHEQDEKRDAPTAVVIVFPSSFYLWKSV